MSAANSNDQGLPNPQSAIRNPQSETGLRTPPVCTLRSFQVYELPGSVEVHLTADHGQTIAWSMSPRMAAALGAKLRFHGRHAAELHPLSRVPQRSEERGEGGDSRPSSPGGGL